MAPTTKGQARVPTNRFADETDRLTGIRLWREVIWESRGLTLFVAFIVICLLAALFTALELEAVAIVWLGFFPLFWIVFEATKPQTASARLRRRARSVLDSAGGRVCVRAIARPLEVLVRAPYSNRLCMAYWACYTGRLADDTGGNDVANGHVEHRVRVVDFVAEVDGSRVSVDAQHVRVLRDPTGGEGARLFAGDGNGTEANVFEPMSPKLAAVLRHQETLLRDGNEVIIEGDLTAVTSSSQGPFRSGAGAATYSMRGTRRRPLTIVLPRA